MYRGRVKNETEKPIAAAVFEAVFYDYEGKEIDVVRKREYEIEANSVRGFAISSDKIRRVLKDNARSYSVKLIKCISADVERVLLKKV